MSKRWAAPAVRDSRSSSPTEAGRRRAAPPRSRSARDAGFERALTIDVGGTSTDVAFADGHLPRRRAREIAGFPILLPLLDVHTVGAGGGSIASIDPGGLLAVGPRSAGAVPGPACYGRGGPATVTDALVVLGRLPEMRIGGSIEMDMDAARAAVTALAPALGARTPAAAAAAILSVANARMEAALRQVSVERGHDPRQVALVAFGGAGGLHACDLAAALGVDAIVFPAHAGVLSAVGAIAAPERHERSRTVLADAGDRATLTRALESLGRAVKGSFARAGRRAIEPRVLARYAGQSHEIEIPFGPDLERRFHEAHRRLHGFAREDATIEIVTVEVEGAVEVTDAPRPRAPRPRRVRPERRARVAVDGRARAVPVWRFEALGGGARIRGPAIVLQSGATLWVDRGWWAGMHASGALVLRRGRP
ncbi:MAG: hydantoinase/oxoprolinase family protein [Candidatus Eisenbacteria bacterium]|uniref:Hydantoinase/oxoprolinase family protein n=1 Tax=Eiseniibacteriota bacterium TaxID=2212470 RepID=A0A538U266_UNCEI|nr:MAG: hydantoinase/oxoprolinase family protein [Candidatus Eisenbacteria bacterium]